MLVIDGSQGEGGGQIVRTSLSLAMILARPICLENIRAGRKKPGLMRQHLTCVEAAAEVCRAQVQGARVGARRLEFRPGAVKAGDYHFSIGTAGSTTLVAQTLLPALVVADGPSKLRIEGGTHNAMCPPWDFLEHSFLPLLAQMGPRISGRLVRHGFYPAGGGCIEIDIEPVAQLQGFTLHDRGPVSLSARALVSSLPSNVGHRELRVLRSLLGLQRAQLQLVEVSDPRGPGNAVLVEAAWSGQRRVFAAFGERRKRAERVAEELAGRVQAWLDAEVPVDVHLADQLLLPLALAGGGSFRTQPPSLHTRTNLEILRLFTGVAGRLLDEGGGAWRVELGESC